MTRHDTTRIDQRSVFAVVCFFLIALAPATAARPQQPAFVESELILELTMEVPVPRAEVYDAWTIADQLVQWFPGFAQMTVTEGGEYRFGWDGWEEEWVGVYVEVDRPERLVFTWQPPASAYPGGAYETIVALIFDEIGDGQTRMTLRHSGFRGGAEMESHMQAWRGYLYNLRAFLLQR